MARLAELERVMRQRTVAVPCAQETGITARAETHDNDYLLVLSGASQAQRDGRFDYGASFSLAPWAIKSAIHYKLMPDRLAILRL
eukprot:6650614-Pyramimonas_sp.AAC.1